MTLMAAAFVIATSSQSFATKNVTFQVDMGIYVQIGLFNLATDTVVIRGDFQLMAGDTGYYGAGLTSHNWGGRAFMMAPSMTNDSIYTLTVAFPDSAAGKTINYKFVIINAANHYVDSTTNGGSWESINNRTYAITSDANQQIPVDYFNQRYTAGVQANITFQADMTNLISEGFDPAHDSIGVRGPTAPLSWGSSITMAPIFGTPTTYSVTVSMTAAVGSSQEYKFFAQGRDLFTNGGWENSGAGDGWDAGGNRVFTFPSASDTTLTAVAPNLDVTAATTTADTVTFSVDMTGAKERYHNSEITGLTLVVLKGGDAPLTWGGTWVTGDTASPSTDVVLADSGNGIWWAKVVFPVQSVSALGYKYGSYFSGADTLNGGTDYMDNEAGFGVNHNVTLAGTNQYLHSKFGDQATAIRQNPNGVKLPQNYSLSQNYPNPFNPTTQINYSIPKNGYVTLKVYNVLGQEVATLFEGNQKAGDYIATFDANRFASGVYFYRLEAGTFSTVKKMVLMK